MIQGQAEGTTLFEGYPCYHRTGGTPEMAARFLDVGGEVDVGQVVAAVQGLVEQGHGVDPVAGVLQDLQHLGWGERPAWSLRRLATIWRLFLTRWWTSLRRAVFLQGFGQGRISPPSACLRSVMTSKMATKCSGLGQYTETENHIYRALT